MNTEGSLLEETRKYAEKVLTEELPNELTYHSLDHTLDVVKAVEQIGTASNLTEEELETVKIAAWFHDLGYASAIEGHEAKSAELSRSFLSEKGLKEERIKLVEGCIMATKMPQNPQNLLEEVLCDADLFHLATEKYCETACKLQEEMRFTKKIKLSDKKWLKMNKEFLVQQEFFTPYAKEHLAQGKLKNLKAIKKQLKESKKDKVVKKEKVEKDLGAEAKPFKPGRGVETMFRLTSKNHLDLSNMADNKANIMISINSIILSIIVTVLVRKLEEFPHLIIPTMIMVVVCLVTIVFSIMSTRPNVSHGKFTREDIKKKKTNLLFFGNFHRMSLEEYEWGMKEMIQDQDYIYSSLTRDIYFLGIVLGKKYRQLRIAYTFFMFGFVIGVLSFIIAEVFFKGQYPY
jgi:predicted metal-dependent HD superfamily phosphohydrolase